MQKPFVFVLIILTAIVTIKSHSLKLDEVQRTKRSIDDEGFFKKIKSGWSTFMEKTEKLAVESYEEVKNLFSKDRKVGDYVLNDINVRFSTDDDEEEDSSSSTTTQLPEESSIDPALIWRRKRENMGDMEADGDEEPESSGEMPLRHRTMSEILEEMKNESKAERLNL